MKNFILVILILCVISCQGDKEASDKIQKETHAAKTKYGKMIEDTKKSAHDLTEKAKEEARLAAEAIEDAAVEVQEEAEDVKHDIEDALHE